MGKRIDARNGCMTLSQKHCVPCRKDAKALEPKEAQALLENLPGWKLVQNNTWLEKTYTFKNFAQALHFTNEVGKIAETQNHHPDIALGWGYVTIRLQTHAVGGLHENDFILAAKIDVIG